VTVRLPVRPVARRRLRPAGRTRPPRPPLPPGLAAANASLGLVALLLLVFVFEVSVMGTVRNVRAQNLAYDQLRTALARGESPIGQLDVHGALVTPGTPIALLQIPAIDLSQVVLEGTTSSVLTGGPGHRRDTPFPGQAGTALIYGRAAAYGGAFHRIDQLGRGDVIQLVTGQGTQLYAVTGVRLAGDPVPIPAAGESGLTLITAGGLPFAPDEVVRVDAELTSDVVPAPAAVLAPGSLPVDEGVLAGDRGAALPLLLWAQLLLVVALGLAWMRAAWGRWQTWVVAVPVIALTGLQVAHQAAMLLPNLM